MTFQFIILRIQTGSRMKIDTPQFVLVVCPRGR